MKPGDLVILNVQALSSARDAYGIGLVLSSSESIESPRCMVMWSGPTPIHRIMSENQRDLKFIR